MEILEALTEETLSLVICIKSVLSSGAYGS